MSEKVLIVVTLVAESQAAYEIRLKGHLEADGPPGLTD